MYDSKLGLEVRGKTLEVETLYLIALIALKLKIKILGRRAIGHNILGPQWENNWWMFMGCFWTNYSWRWFTPNHATFGTHGF